MLRAMPIKAFQDNYFWAIYQDGSKDTWIVDPGDAGPVFEWLNAEQRALAAILVTHHHQDHTGGIKDLLAAFPVPVFGPDSTRIDTISQVLHEGSTLEIAGRDAEVIAVPGHTLDHIAYYLPACADEAPALFCGDTLFAAGCGRIFEGDANMMYRSLQKLAALPAATRVYAAHEYTLSNLRFARAVLPEDAALAAREQQDSALRAQNQATLPTTIAAELATNPFLRAGEAALQAAVSRHEQHSIADSLTAFAALRQWKDVF